MDAAPIAEDFFKRLLRGTDPLEAVGTLSDRWGVRAKSTGPWLGLSRPEHQVSMALIYVGEVGNGGHTQFFSNRGGEIVARVQAALRDVGLVELRAILGSACALFPGGKVPGDRAEVDRLLEAWGEDLLAAIVRLDRRVGQQDAYPRLLIYLQEHESEVFDRSAGSTSPDRTARVPATLEGSSSSLAWMDGQPWKARRLALHGWTANLGRLVV